MKNKTEKEKTLDHVFQSDDASKRFCADILRFAKKNGMTQKDIAKKLGVPPAVVSRMLSGQNLTIKTMVLLAGAVDCRAALSIDGEESSPPEHKPSMKPRDPTQENAWKVLKQIDDCLQSVGSLGNVMTATQGRFHVWKATAALVEATAHFELGITWLQTQAAFDLAKVETAEHLAKINKK